MRLLWDVCSCAATRRSPHALSSAVASPSRDGH